MSSCKCTFIWIFLLVTAATYSQDGTLPATTTKELQDQSFKDLSVSEWKRFKSFEKQLLAEQLNVVDQESRLLAYTRDSIRILGVKLMAVKLLDEKELLDRDIEENTSYYIALLEKLKKSAIPETEYLFLEEKMALINQELLENELTRSRWFIAGLLLACLVLGFLAYGRKVGQQYNNVPELSKQEHTIRNLIVQGKTNKEIANELFISLSTVKTHITNIYGKLNVSSRQELLQKSTGTST